MSLTVESPTLGKPSHAGPAPLRLIRAEIMKIRTTNTWWLFLIGIVLVTGLALLVNGLQHHYELYPPVGQGGEGGDFQARVAAAHTSAGLARIAADMLTSGQFFGLLFAMIMGALVVTNEFFHQTATTTFMTNPHRSSVLFAKAVAAIVFGGLFWLMATVIDVIVTPIYLNSQHVSVSLTQWTVVRSVLLNLLGFAVWAVFGLGLGTLIRSQIGSVVTGIVLYLLGSISVAIIFNLIHNAYSHDWVLSAQVIAPAIASALMINPGQAFDHQPPHSVGGVVLFGYALVTGAIGLIITRRRDIS
jgi:ABC-2 type transport system permease protein